MSNQSKRPLNHESSWSRAWTSRYVEKYHNLIFPSPPIFAIPYTAIPYRVEQVLKFLIFNIIFLLFRILFVLLVDPLLFLLPLLLPSQLLNLFNLPHLFGHLSHLPGPQSHLSRHLPQHLPGLLPHLPQHLPLLCFKQSLLYPLPPQPQWGQVRLPKHQDNSLKKSLRFPLLRSLVDCPIHCHPFQQYLDNLLTLLFNFAFCLYTLVGMSQLLSKYYETLAEFLSSIILDVRQEKQILAKNENLYFCLHLNFLASCSLKNSW